MTNEHIEAIFAVVLGLFLAYVCYQVAYEFVVTIHAYNLATSLPASL